MTEWLSFNVIGQFIWDFLGNGSVEESFPDFQSHQPLAMVIDSS